MKSTVKKEEFSALVATHVTAGVSPQKAIVKAAKQNPTLYRAMMVESNPSASAQQIDNMVQDVDGK